MLQKEHKRGQWSEEDLLRWVSRLLVQSCIHESFTNSRSKRFQTRTVERTPVQVNMPPEIELSQSIGWYERSKVLNRARILDRPANIFVWGSNGVKITPNQPWVSTNRILQWAQIILQCLTLPASTFGINESHTESGNVSIMWNQHMNKLISKREHHRMKKWFP